MAKLKDYQRIGRLMVDSSKTVRMSRLEQRLQMVPETEKYSYDPRVNTDQVKGHDYEPYSCYLATLE